MSVFQLEDLITTLLKVDVYVLNQQVMIMQTAQNRQESDPEQKLWNEHKRFTVR